MKSLHALFKMEEALCQITEVVKRAELWVFVVALVSKTTRISSDLQIKSTMSA